MKRIVDSHTGQRYRALLLAPPYVIPKPGVKASLDDLRDIRVLNPYSYISSPTGCMGMPQPFRLQTLTPSLSSLISSVPCSSTQLWLLTAGQQQRPLGAFHFSCV